MQASGLEEKQRRSYLVECRMSMDHMTVKTSDVRKAASDYVSKDMKVRKPMPRQFEVVEDRKFEPRTIPGFACFCCLRLFGRNQSPRSSCLVLTTSKCSSATC